MITCCIHNTFLVLTLKNYSLEREESWLCQHSQEPGIAGQQLWGKCKTLPVFSGALSSSNLKKKNQKLALLTNPSLAYITKVNNYSDTSIWEL